MDKVAQRCRVLCMFCAFCLLEMLSTSVAPGESQFTTGVKSRTGLRVLGWTILGGGSLIGAAMVLSSSEKKCEPGYTSDICVIEMNSTLFYGGSMVMGVSIGVGLGLALGVSHG